MHSNPPSIRFVAFAIWEGILPTLAPKNSPSSGFAMIDGGPDDGVQSDAERSGCAVGAIGFHCGYGRTPRDCFESPSRSAFHPKRNDLPAWQSDFPVFWRITKSSPVQVVLVNMALPGMGFLVTMGLAYSSLRDVVMESRPPGWKRGIAESI